MESCWSKVMERIINSRLVWWAEKKILDENQNGFRRGKGCVDNFIEFTVDIRKSLLEGKKVIAAFLDVSSAYYNVLRNILIEKLRKEECPSKILKFVDGWNQEDSLLMKIFEDRILEQGVPQGRVLSPNSI